MNSYVIVLEDARESKIRWESIADSVNKGLQ